MVRYLIALLAWRRAYAEWQRAFETEDAALTALLDAECEAGLCGCDPRITVTT